MKLGKFFATFGAIHAYHGCYVEIDAVDRHTARWFMIDTHHNKWGAVFSEAEFASQLSKPGMDRLAHFQQVTNDRNDYPRFERVRAANG